MQAVTTKDVKPLTEDDFIKALAAGLRAYDQQSGGQLTRMMKGKAKTTKEHAPRNVWEWFSTPAPIFRGQR